MTTEKQVFQIKHFNRGDIICEEGDAGDCTYLVKSGTVNIYRVINNKKVVLAALKSGQIFGEMAVITKDPRSASVEAAEDCALVVIDENSLNNALDQSMTVVKAMVQQLINRFRDAEKKSTQRKADRVFMGVCRVIYLTHIKNSEIVYDELCQIIEDEFDISRVETDSVLERLGRMSLLRFEPRGDKVFIIPVEPESFLKNVREINYESPVSLTEKDQEFIDIDEFASIVKTTPREILRRIGTGNIPPDLFYFSKEASSRWADEIGADYFKRSYKGYEVQEKRKSKYS